MAFRMPSGAKKALMGLGMSRGDYNAFRKNLSSLHNNWQPGYGDFDEYTKNYISEFRDYLKGGSASSFAETEQDAGNLLQGTSYERGLSQRLDEESKANNAPKLLGPGKGNANNNPVTEILRQQNTKTSLPSTRSKGAVNSEIPINNAGNNASPGVINDGGTPSHTSINYSTDGRKAGTDGGIINNTVPTEGPQGFANSRINIDNNGNSGGSINAGGTPKDASPNDINATTAAPASNPGPDNIDFGSSSGISINNGVSANSKNGIANSSTSNNQFSFGDVKQSGPSINPKKTGPAYTWDQFQGKYRPSSGGKMNAAEEYMTKNRWDEINDDWARAQEAKKAGNQEEYDNIIGRYGGATSRRGFQDHMLGNMQKNGPGVMDYVWGYKMPQTVVGAGLVFGLGSEIAGANNGQKSNADLYSAPM